MIYNVSDAPSDAQPIGEGTIFAIPFPRGEWCKCCHTVHNNVASTLPCYKVHLIKSANTDDNFRHALIALAGKPLICCCARPGQTIGSVPYSPVCHGQVILEWLHRNVPDLCHEIHPLH